MNKEIMNDPNESLNHHHYQHQSDQVTNYFYF
jgi:hypothetical protein